MGSAVSASKEVPVRKCLIIVTVAAGWIGAAGAQEASSSSSLNLTVRPSSFSDVTEEARLREERLIRRMERNEFLFRHICTQCGSAANGPSAPFEPMQALGAVP
jgi:hypothetical protein